MTPLTLNERIQALREAGLVARSHTMPYNGIYNVAMHCFNALNLLLLLHNTSPPSLNLIKAVVWHDIPERWTGDVPSPAKWASSRLRETLNALEDKIFKRLEISEVFEDLTEREKHWLIGVDLMELYLWAKENGHKNVLSRVASALEERHAVLPKEIWDFLIGHSSARLPECDEFLREII